MKVVFPQAYQCYKSVSVPAWNAYALGFQLNTPTSEDSYPFGANKENLGTIKGIVTKVQYTSYSDFTLDQLLIMNFFTDSSRGIFS